MLARFTIAALLAIVSAGCQSARPKAPTFPAPTSEQIEAADIGPVPDLEDGRAAAMQLARAGLKDPVSAQFQWPQGWTRSYLAQYGKPPRIAWALRYRVNAKNAMGGYVGFRSYAIYAERGYVVGVATPGSGDMNAMMDRALDVELPVPALISDLAARHEAAFGALAAR